MSTSPWVADPETQRRLACRAQLLAGASVTYNLIEAVIAVSAGLIAGSVALVGFGLDSTIEVSSGLIILWKFRHPLPHTRERTALRLLAISFLALAGYVAFESVRALLQAHRPESSPVGIGLATASLMVMPFLSWWQRRTGRALGSNAVVADGTQTLLCSYLSAVLLCGLVLNSTLGWYWADPLAGLVIAGIAMREGLGLEGAWMLHAASDAGPRSSIPLGMWRRLRRRGDRRGHRAGTSLTVRQVQPSDFSVSHLKDCTPQGYFGLGLAPPATVRR